MTQSTASYADVASRARQAATAAATTVPARKTPSPKPPSPQPFLGTPRAKGSPSPPPPPMLSREMRSGFSSSERRSPKPQSERMSPTSAAAAAKQGAGSPTEQPSPVQPYKQQGGGAKGHTRSLSTSTTPTPPAGQPPNSRVASLGPRSKSQASEAYSGQSRVGTEAKRPVARRPDTTVETRDSYTQTEGGELGDIWGTPLENDGMGMSSGMEMDAPLDNDISIQDDEPSLSSSADGTGTGEEDNGFLSQHIRMQAELEMALRSQMEMIAEGPTPTPPPGESGDEHGGAQNGNNTIRPNPPSSMRHNQHTGRRHNHSLRSRGPQMHPTQAEAMRALQGGHDSDGDAIDDEVKSLSLSEDGPVIRRSLSEGGAGHFFGLSGCGPRSRHAAAAPDPIAMLTDGTRKAMLSARSVITGDGQTSRSPEGGAVSDLRSSGEGSGIADLADGRGSADKVVDVSEKGPEAEVEEITHSVHSADGDAPCSDRSADRSVPNESDHSAAPTHYYSQTGEQISVAPPPASDSSSLYQNLMPVLSKVITNTPPPQGQLEVVQENAPGVAPHKPGEGPGGVMRRGWRPAKSVRVPAVKGHSADSTKVQALDLSQVKLPPLGTAPGQQGGAGATGGATPTAPGACCAAAAKSDDQVSHVSFGSAHSAFTCWSSTSSPSSSHLASPRPRPLKTTASMPALHNHGK